jgi:hypothetical protein
MLRYFVAFSYINPEGQLRMGNTNIMVSREISSMAEVTIMEQQVSKKCSDVTGVKLDVVIINFTPFN